MNCKFIGCTDTAINQPLVLKSGGKALCMYCAKHAAAKGFIIPAPPAPLKIKPPAPAKPATPVAAISSTGVSPVAPSAPAPKSIPAPVATESKPAPKPKS